MLAKLKSWIQSLARWTKENPIKAGLITFLPVLAAAGAAKMLGGLGKMLGKGKSEADKVISANRKVIEQSRKAKKDGKKVWGWGLDELYVRLLLFTGTIAFWNGTTLILCL